MADGDRGQPDGEERLRALLRNVSDTINVIDLDGRIIWHGGNPGGTLGQPDDHWQGQSGLDLVHPDDLPRVNTLLEELLASPGREVRSEMRLRNADGSWTYVDAYAVNLLDDALIGGIVLTTRNINDRKGHELLLADEARILEGITRGTALEDTLADLEVLVTSRIDGASAAVHLDDADVGITGPWTRVLHGPDAGERVGILLVVPGEDRPPTEEEVSILDVVAHVSALAIERDRAQARLAFLALHDSLTGLPNRTLLLDRLATGLLRIERHPEVTLAVVFCDLDRFKLVNDGFGHPVGDAVLIEFAERLQRVTRPGDTVARFGGDELVVLCEEVEDEEHARALAGRIEAALAEPFSIDGNDVVLTASIGVAIAHSSLDRPDVLLRDADAAMYRAKERGRARIEVADRSLHDRAVARLRVEGELRTALARGEIIAHYEPLVSLETGEIVGVEALARWRHPRRGLLDPAAFLPVAEDSGLIVRVDEAVIDCALRDAAQWLNLLGPDRVLHVSVNVSSRHVVSGEVVETVRRVLEDHDWPAVRLAIELTEGVLLHDDAALQQTLANLREIGVSIVVDDFGTGFSSLGYLHRFPVDTVKIDRSFVERLGTRGSEAALVAAVVGMADALGLQTIGEGVETAAQRDALGELGCRLAQGFLFSPPVGADELRDLLANRTVG
jgi:diguanylate cyclase (GGDEF)-like protein/PAS domain S-box-containing protein